MTRGSLPQWLLKKRPVSCDYAVLGHFVSSCCFCQYLIIFAFTGGFSLIFFSPSTFMFIYFIISLLLFYQPLSLIHLLHTSLVCVGWDGREKVHSWCMLDIFSGKVALVTEYFWHLTMCKGLPGQQNVSIFAINSPWFRSGDKLSWQYVGLCKEGEVCGTQFVCVRISEEREMSTGGGGDIQNTRPHPSFPAPLCCFFEGHLFLSLPWYFHRI